VSVAAKTVTRQGLAGECGSRECIGSGTSVGDGATIIGPTLIGSGCVIQPGATLRDCILADYTRISSVAVLEQKLVFGSKCIEPSGTYLDIEESQIRWLVDDARNNENLSESELMLLEEVKTLTV
jgi:mannose-1-phosphate guanylyltransferase